MDLFAASRQKHLDAAMPLAARMRPRSLEEFAGQQHFLAPGKLLRRMLTANRITSILFYGPPGTGKTTLARLIANHVQAHYEQLNAASSGVKEVRSVLDGARDRLETSGRRTVLFLDEIHRFNRAQQDILLPDVESGLITLIGATTENPFFSVNAPLVSRSQIFQFQPLGEADIRSVLQRALTDPDRGFGKLPITLDDEARELWVTTCDGDGRRALTALEIAVLSLLEDGATDRLHITLDVAQESIQRKDIVYDCTCDDHYDAAIALIKSMRGSDPDASLYWLARMLEAGEDPRFIARRIAILASEDIGLADPGALTLAASAFAITERVGMPECQLTLAQAVIYMACAPKSNSVTTAIGEASKDVREGRTIPVPIHLRDAHYAGAATLGHGQNYKYPHDHPGGIASQTYLGVDKSYYHPTDRGLEARIAERLSKIRSSIQIASPDGATSPQPIPPEPRINQ